MSLLDKFRELEKSEKEISQEAKKNETIPEKISPKPEKNIDLLNEPQIESKKLKIGSANLDLDLLGKNLDRTIGFDISNVNISQDDLWLLYRLKFGTSTRNKRSVLLPQFTEAFKKNLAKMKN